MDSALFNEAICIVMVNMHMDIVFDLYTVDAENKKEKNIKDMGNK